MKLKIKPLNNDIKDMYKEHGHFHEGDSGLDLFIKENQMVKAGETKQINLGISCESTNGCSYFLMPRSSISLTPLRMSNSVGLIDGGYRGELKVFVDNISDDPFELQKGNRFFQLVAMNGDPISFTITEHLSETKRGKGGFGSTGM
jgi:dUTPase